MSAWGKVHPSKASQVRHFMLRTNRAQTNWIFVTTQLLNECVLMLNALDVWCCTKQCSSSSCIQSSELPNYIHIFLTYRLYIKWTLRVASVHWQHSYSTGKTWLGKKPAKATWNHTIPYYLLSLAKSSERRLFKGPEVCQRVESGGTLKTPLHPALSCTEASRQLEASGG